MVVFVAEMDVPELIVTVLLDVELTPLAVAVQVYVVVLVGETVIDGVVAPPGLQE